LQLLPLSLLFWGVPFWGVDDRSFLFVPAAQRLSTLSCPASCACISTASHAALLAAALYGLAGGGFAPSVSASPSAALLCWCGWLAGCGPLWALARGAAGAAWRACCVELPGASSEASRTLFFPSLRRRLSSSSLLALVTLVAPLACVFVLRVSPRAAVLCSVSPSFVSLC